MQPCTNGVHLRPPSHPSASRHDLTSWLSRHLGSQPEKGPARHTPSTSHRASSGATWRLNGRTALWLIKKAHRLRLAPGSAAAASPVNSPATSARAHSDVTVWRHATYDSYSARRRSIGRSAGSNKRRSSVATPFAGTTLEAAPAPAAAAGADAAATPYASDASTVSLPINYYEMLEVSPEAPPEAVRLMCDAKLGSPPGEGFSADALSTRAQILEAARDTLLDEALRAEYDDDLARARESNPDLNAVPVDVPLEKAPGLLCLLQEVGRASAVADIGLALLAQKPDKTASAATRAAAQLSAAARRDVALAVSLAYSDLAREAMTGTPAAVAHGCELLEASLSILQVEGGSAFAIELQRSIEETLLEMGPTCILELLALPLGKDTDSARQDGVEGMRTLLWKKGPDGKLAGNAGGFSREVFMKEAFLRMTTSEVIDYFNAAPASVDAGLLEVYWVALAYLGRAFFYRRPGDVTKGEALLEELEDSPLFRALAAAALADSLETEESPSSPAGVGGGAGETSRGAMGSAGAMLPGTDVPASLAIERAMCAMLLGQVEECKRRLGLDSWPPSGDPAVARFVYANSPGAAELQQGSAGAAARGVGSAGGARAMVDPESIWATAGAAKADAEIFQQSPGAAEDAGGLGGAVAQQTQQQGQIGLNDQDPENGVTTEEEVEPLLPGLCLLLEVWMREVVSMRFRDTCTEPVRLEAYFDDPNVGSFLESLEENGGVRESSRDQIEGMGGKGRTLGGGLESLLQLGGGAKGTLEAVKGVLLPWGGESSGEQRPAVLGAAAAAVGAAAAAAMAAPVNGAATSKKSAAGASPPASAAASAASAGKAKPGTDRSPLGVLLQAVGSVFGGGNGRSSGLLSGLAGPAQQARNRAQQELLQGASADLGAALRVNPASRSSRTSNGSSGSIGSSRSGDGVVTLTMFVRGISVVLVGGYLAFAAIGAWQRQGSGVGRGDRGGPLTDLLRSLQPAAVTGWLRSPTGGASEEAAANADEGDLPPLGTAEVRVGRDGFVRMKETGWGYRLLRQWQQAKAGALGREHKVGMLKQVLDGPMLELWEERAKEVQAKGWYWEYQFLNLIVEEVWVSKDQKAAVLQASIQEAARLVDASDPNHNDSYKSTYTARYEIQQNTGQGWRITGGTVLR